MHQNCAPSAICDRGLDPSVSTFTYTPTYTPILRFVQIYQKLRDLFAFKQTAVETEKNSFSTYIIWILVYTYMCMYMHWQQECMKFTASMSTILYLQPYKCLNENIEEISRKNVVYKSFPIFYFCALSF